MSEDSNEVRESERVGQHEGEEGEGGDRVLGQNGSASYENGGADVPMCDNSGGHMRKSGDMGESPGGGNTNLVPAKKKGYNHHARGLCVSFVLHRVAV